MCMHYVILMLKAELDQLVDGLNAMNMLSLIRRQPIAARQIFIQATQNKSSDV